MKSQLTDGSDPTGGAPKFGRSQKRSRMIEAINDAAAEVFMRDGYADFSARKVAKELGISLSNLQHYCGNTDDLCFQMIKSKLEYYTARSQDTYACTTMTPMDKFALVMRENISATYSDFTARLFFQMGALATQDERIREVMIDQYEIFLDLLKNLIRQINPNLGSASVQTYSGLIATMIEGNFFYQWQPSITLSAREDMINGAIKIWSEILERDQ